MSAKIFSVLCLLVAVCCIYAVSAASSEYDDTYYDKKTKVVSQKVAGTESANPLKLVSFNGGDCQCSNLACSCCTGVRVKKLKFDKEVCAVIEYLKQEIGVGASIKVNQKQLLSTSVSVSNPPPVCLRVPDFPAVQLCLRFHDLQISGGKLHACADLETRVTKLPVLALHFKCITV
ncbi:uncharacterized protein LOC100877839 [Megachile rotundata]|uniref:uncharacterized protein LOC100877839 n=1 Tax=Megachile rotundata TaxID=143995 RepID=UPI003FD69F8E